MKLAERIFKRIDYRRTSPYGWRTHPVTGVRKFHQGEDYGTQLEKWPQYALESGKVVSCGKDWAGMGAIFAWVEYPRLKTRLLHYHLDELKVSRGQVVNENTIIGTTGRSGRATGIHLHLGVKLFKEGKWVYVDPDSINFIPLEPSNMGDLNPITVGDRVTITGTTYATGQKIPEWVKAKTFTVSKLYGQKALLKEILSWVYLKDLKK